MHTHVAVYFSGVKAYITCDDGQLLYLNVNVKKYLHVWLL